MLYRFACLLPLPAFGQSLLAAVSCVLPTAGACLLLSCRTPLTFGWALPASFPYPHLRNRAWRCLLLGCQHRLHQQRATPVPVRYNYAIAYALSVSSSSSSSSLRLPPSCRESRRKAAMLSMLLGGARSVRRQARSSHHPPTTFSRPRTCPATSFRLCSTCPSQTSPRPVADQVHQSPCESTL